MISMLRSPGTGSTGIVRVAISNSVQRVIEVVIWCLRLRELEYI